MEHQDSEPAAEEHLFKCEEAYVYRVPPVASLGHRAETWDVNAWLSEVGVFVESTDTGVVVRLVETSTGDLFAECPIPEDLPLAASVEPVIDSSRYFALKVSDPSSGRHAFLGLGFRQREQAGGFVAALQGSGSRSSGARAGGAGAGAREGRGIAGAVPTPPAAAADASPSAESISLRRASPGSCCRATRTEVGGGRVASKGVPKSFSFLLDDSGGAVAALAPLLLGPSGADAGIGSPTSAGARTRWRMPAPGSTPRASGRAAGGEEGERGAEGPFRSSPPRSPATGSPRGAPASRSPPRSVLARDANAPPSRSALATSSASPVSAGPFHGRSGAFASGPAEPSSPSVPVPRNSSSSSLETEGSAPSSHRSRLAEGWGLATALGDCSGGRPSVSVPASTAAAATARASAGRNAELSG